MRERQPLMEQNLEFLRDTYGVSVNFDGFSENDSPLIISCETIADFKRPDVVRTIREAVSKYPVTYINRIGAQEIRAVQNLRLNYRVLGGNVMVNGLALEDNSTVYVSTSKGIRGLGNTTHHELFHLSDYAFTKGPLRKLRTTAMNIFWSRLNRPKFPGYVRGRYPFMKINDLEAIKEHGFIRIHGVLSEEEDRATVADMLMSDPAEMMFQADHDPILFRKVARIIWYFEKRSNGLMDREYFSDLLQGKVVGDYWQNRTKPNPSEHS